MGPNEPDENLFPLIKNQGDKAVVIPLNIEDNPAISHRIGRFESPFNISKVVPNSLLSFLMPISKGNLRVTMD